MVKSTKQTGFSIQIVLLIVTQLHIGLSLTGQSKNKSINQSIAEQLRRMNRNRNFQIWYRPD